jgi:hypothetical protein
MQLAQIPQVQFTQAGLILPDTLSKDESVRIFRALREMGDAVEFALGDWANHHERSFGKESLHEVLKQEEFPWARTFQAQTISQLPHDERRPRTLSPKHHLAIAKVQQPEKRQQWLAIAEQERLTPIELTRSIRKGTVVHQADHKSETGLGIGRRSTEAVRESFIRWIHQIADTEEEALKEIATWPTHVKTLMLAPLRDIVLFVQKVDT